MTIDGIKPIVVVAKIVAVVRIHVRAVVIHSKAAASNPQVQVVAVKISIAVVVVPLAGHGGADGPKGQVVRHAHAHAGPEAVCRRCGEAARKAACGQTCAHALENAAQHVHGNLRI